ERVEAPPLSRLTRHQSCHAPLYTFQQQLSRQLFTDLSRLHPLRAVVAEFVRSRASCLPKSHDFSYVRMPPATLARRASEGKRLRTSHMLPEFEHEDRFLLVPARASGWCAGEEPSPHLVFIR